MHGQFDIAKLSRAIKRHQDYIQYDLEDEPMPIYLREKKREDEISCALRPKNFGVMPSPFSNYNPF